MKLHQKRKGTSDRGTRNDPSLPILPSIENVVKVSRMVFFHPERIEPAVLQWGDLPQARASWHNPCHYFDSGLETVRWIFVLDVLNHCFWPDEGQPTWTVEYRDSQYSGYWGLAASLKRALEDGLPITDASYLADITSEDLRRIFSGKGEIPLFEQRLFNLREAGRTLLSEWNGDIVHLLEASAGSAVRAVRLVVSSFPSFRDEALYHGQRTYFWKRAQIFAADLHGAFDAKGWGEFYDIEKLTAFADYKLPQVLRELGVISYHQNLARRIDGMEMIESGSEEEMEIRAMTIMAVEALKEGFQPTGQKVTSTWVDGWLWQLGQLEPFRQSPYHRCRSIYY